MMRKNIILFFLLSGLENNYCGSLCLFLQDCRSSPVYTITLVGLPLRKFLKLSAAILISLILASMGYHAI